MKEKAFVPKYKSIYMDMARKIQSGEFPAGSRLPYERELCAQYGVERVTIRHALQLLEEDNLIQKQAGRGSFVSGPAAQPAPLHQSILFAMNRSYDIRSIGEFNSKMFFRMEDVCHRHGCSLMYAGIKDSGEHITGLEDGPVAGVLLVSRHGDALVEEVAASGTPVICVNHFSPRVQCVMPDNMSGVREAVARLRAWGHERIGFISGPLTFINAQERLAAFRHGLWENGLPIDERLIVESDWTYEGGVQAMKEIMGAGEPPTAVCTASDMMAIGAIEAARQLGLRVPEDLSVVGFDNIDMGLYCAPSLTTVSVDAQQIAVVAVEALLRFRREKPTPADRYVIRVPARLVERASAGPVPARE